MKAFSISFLLSLAMLSVSAQTGIKDLSAMFGKKWKTVEYGFADVRLPATDILPGDGTIFLPDGTYSSVDKGAASTGKWSYDATSGILTVHKNGIDEVNMLRVLKLSETEAVMETISEHKEEDGQADHSHQKEQMTLYLEGER